MLFLSPFVSGFASSPQCPSCPTCPSCPSTTCPNPEYDVTKYFNGCGAAYPPGTYSMYINIFNGVIPYTIATAGECIVKDDWQTYASKQKEEGIVCFTGPFDGHVAFAMKKVLPGEDKMVMRYIVNSEIRPRSSSGFTGHTSPVFSVSTNPAKGGWGQENPSPSETMPVFGATLMYIDEEREAPYKVVDAGHAIKKVYTVKQEYHNKLIPGDAKSGDVLSIVTTWSDLHNNVRADQDTPRPITRAQCDTNPEYCGLYAHCGSSLSMKHAYSYASPTTGGVKIDGVGFEDDIAWVAHEGTYSEGGLRGTIQLLDVATGDYYQLPQVSAGVTETTFSISTGHPDYVAAIIQEYGVSGYFDDAVKDTIDASYPTGRASSFGSSINLYLGKKDKSAGAHFLDRNGLGVNQGRVYHFVADDGETDTATYFNWPASGENCNLFSGKTGRFEPLPKQFDGRYRTDEDGDGGYETEHWTAEFTNGAKSMYGNERLHMTAYASQEWGSVSVMAPGSFAIAHTTLSRSKKPSGMPADINTNRGTVTFWTAKIREAILSGSKMDGSVTNHAGETLPKTIDATADAVMADAGYGFPERDHRGVDRGAFKPDGLVFLKDGSVLYQEDQSHDKQNGYMVKYWPNGKPATDAGIPSNKQCTAKLVAGAAQKENPLEKPISTPPYGAFTGPSANELTGAFDVSAALTVGENATPEDYFNALTSKHISVNTQIWNARGDGNSAKSPGGTNCLAEYQLGWSGQMNLLHLDF